MRAPACPARIAARSASKGGTSRAGAAAGISLARAFGSCAFCERGVGIAHEVSSNIASFVVALDPPYLMRPARRVGRAPPPPSYVSSGLRERGPPPTTTTRNSQTRASGCHLIHRAEGGRDL